jgi:uncharacterized membrane protein
MRREFERRFVMAIGNPDACSKSKHSFACSTPETRESIWIREQAKKGGLIMASPASFAKHPIHPMLVALPIGLWIFSLVSDVIYLMKWGGAVFNDVAFYTMAGGIVTALVAAVPGFIDYLSLPKGKIKTIAVWHMRINLAVFVLFAINLWLRRDATPGAAVPVWLSVVGVVLLGVSGWLGGELVYVHGVAVEPQSSAEEIARQRETTKRAA